MINITGSNSQFSRPNLIAGSALGACDVIFFGLDTHSLRADISKARGSHSLKAGFDGRLMRNNTWQITERTFNFDNAFTQGPVATRPSGTAGFAYASFLLGYAASGNNAISPAMAAQYLYYAGFFQDDWRVNRRLTLNLGMRWEYSAPRTDRYNQLTNFDYAATPPLTAPGLNIRGVLAYPGVGRTAAQPAGRRLEQLRPSFWLRIAGHAEDRRARRFRNLLCAIADRNRSGRALRLFGHHDIRCFA